MKIEVLSPNGGLLCLEFLKDGDQSRAVMEYKNQDVTFHVNGKEATADELMELLRR